MRPLLSILSVLLIFWGEALSANRLSSRSSPLFARDANQLALRRDGGLALHRRATSSHHRLQRRLIVERAIGRRAIHAGQIYEFPDADPTYRKLMVHGVKGQGAVATVYFANSVLHPEIHCAIKYIHTNFELFLKESKFEDDFFKRVHGLPHVVQRLASKKKPGTDMTEAMVLELCDYTLADEITRYPQHKETWNQRLKEHLIGILEGVVSLHEMSPPMVHGDVKPDNVLLKNGVIKLGDLGLATDKLQSNIQAGNDHWISPWGLAEDGGWPYNIAIKTDQHHTHYDTRKKDVWSVGVTMVQMISGGRGPWRRADDPEYTVRFLHDEGHLHALGVSPEANRLLRDKVFVPKDTDRITARQFLEAVRQISTFTTLGPPPQNSISRGSAKRKYDGR